ncbi:MAG: elongation factor P [bacterium]
MNDLKIGTTVTWKGAPHVVVLAQHVQMGRGGAILRTKLRNVLTGNVFEETFKSGDRLEEADMGRGKASYLYTDGEQCHFMDSVSFDQFSLPASELGLRKNFLKEGVELDVMTYQDRPVSVNLPIKMTFVVTQTVDASRGNTAQGNVLKDATIETGYTLKVPLFVKQGEKIVVNTETGEYVERA